MIHIFFILILSVYDCREKQVPVVLLSVGGAVTAILMVVQGLCGQQLLYLLPAVLPGVFLLLVAFVTKKAGYADGIVLILVWAVCGYQEAVLAFAISLFVLALASVLLLLLHKVNGRTRIPYLPFLTAALALQRIMPE